MNYNEALNFIKEKESLGIQPGLTRIKSALDSLGNPQNDYKTIHIAGTNGKGTVAATISEALCNGGYSVGLFTSPWVTDYREQIQLNGNIISETDFANLIDVIKDYECTEFELITVAAYLYFSRNSVDYAVIECGMGGAEDATNTENENLAVITSISLDHTDFLGANIEKIAEQKAGILRKNCNCILYNSELKRIFENRCKNVITIPEKNNLSLVNAVLKEIGLDTVDVLVNLPARHEIIGDVLLDGGHNVSAAEKLAPYLENETAVIAMLKDKNVEGYLSIIAPLCKTIVATSVDSPRAMPSAELADIAEDYCDNVYICDNPEDAIKIENLSLVCGSFYLAREIRKKLIDEI